MANEVKDFGLGTIKGFLGKGGKGMLYGVAAALLIGTGVGVLAGGAIMGLAGLAGVGTIAATATTAAATATWLTTTSVIAGIGAGIVTAMGTFTGAVTLGGGIGAAWGALTGGKKEMNKSARAEAESLSATQAQADYRLQQAQQKNMAVRQAIAHQGQGQADRAANYQMQNHLTDGLAENHHRSKFTSNKATEQGQAQGGMSK